MRVTLRVKMALGALAPTVSRSDPENEDLNVAEKYVLSSRQVGYDLEVTLTVSMLQTNDAPGEATPKGEHAPGEECSDDELDEKKSKGMMHNTEKALLDILGYEKDALGDMPATEGASIRHRNESHKIYDHPTSTPLILISSPNPPHQSPPSVDPAAAPIRRPYKLRTIRRSLLNSTTKRTPPNTGTSFTNATKTNSSRIGIIWRRIGGVSLPKMTCPLMIGCGSGSSVFPLLAAFPNIYVHACDFSPQAILLLKANVNFREDRVNAFVSDVTHEDLCDNIDPFSVDVVTLVFMLSAVSPRKMPLILQNFKKVIKPNGYVLLRDYAVGDFAQVKLQNKDQMIGEDFYVRGDGTCSFYFSEDFLSTLFLNAGFNTVDLNTYCREVYNRSRNIMMDRYCPFVNLLHDDT
ncbi:uncharacterized protein LOC21396639 [Morus notabilis]|uniref:uncharacterized protein LOC21396639 n=1 Tax=Morus notabilis TaxID=981085 RepID=UPI000CED59E0|nr:uncharacterized protein LOC21396639 [Morus notabilis]